MPHTNNRDGSRTFGRTKSGSTYGKGGSSGPSKWKGKQKEPAAVFDDAARAEYLTGFSKRKKERTEAARARAVEREKQEKRDLRKQLHETRRGKAESNVKEQAEFYGTDAFADGPAASGPGADDEEAEERDRSYEDAGRRTTVTVEDFSIDHDELSSPARPHQRPAPLIEKSRPSTKPSASKKPKSSLGAGGKAKKKRVPYESKATRTIERAKKERKRASKKEGKRK